MNLVLNKVKKNILQVKLDKRTEVHNWGGDNAFPTLVETLINYSVSAKACVNKVAKAIYGKSFGKIGKAIVNAEGQTLNEVLRLAAREYATHNNLFLHVGYNGLLQIKSIKVIPVKYTRVGKSDDLGYSGKFIVYNNWDKQNGKIDVEKFKVYNKYNPIKKVIESQIERAGSITNYKGQILHIHQDSNSVYSLSDLYPVQGEALLENNSSTFRLNGSEKGFLLNKLLITQPFDSDEAKRNFINTYKEMQGVNNTGDILLLEAGQVTDNLNNQLKLEDLSSNYNDKLFEYSDSQAEKNISKAYGVPLVLIDTSNDGLFGNSGEMLKQAKLQLWESKEEERDMIEEVFQKLMENYHEPLNGELQIINPNQKSEINE